MTGIRTSAIFKPEKEFGVEDANGSWHRFPSGLSFGYQPRNNIKTYFEIGNKFYDRAVAGNFSGTFNITFKMDYECIDFLGAVFEGYEYDAGTKTHTFRKANGKRVPSFSVRVKKMNRIVGGSADTTVILVGCVVTSFSMAHNGSSDATSNVTISGNYANESMDKDDLDETDWQDYYNEDDEGYDKGDIVPVEWTCVTINGEPVAYTENATFGVSNSVSMVPGCGVRFSENYSEGQSNVTLSTSCYSVNPETYYQRMYSGGYDTTLLKPKSKGLQPIPLMALKSQYDGDYALTVNLYNVTVDSDGNRNYTANGRIMDSPSLQISSFDMQIKNKTGKITIWE